MKRKIEKINECNKNKENYEKSKIVGRNIKNIRKQKRLTEMQLGKMIGKSRKFISLIEYPRYGREIFLDSLFDIIRENISVPLTLQKLPHKKIEKMVRSLAERFGIASQLDKYPNELGFIVGVIEKEKSP